MTTKSMAWRMVLVVVAAAAWTETARAQTTQPDEAADEMAPPPPDAAVEPPPTYPPPRTTEPTQPPPDDGTLPPDEGLPPPDEGMPPPRHEHPHEHAREESGGRGSEFLWFGPEVGLALVNLKMISYDQLLPSETDVEATGLGFGAAGGIRIKIISIGLHLAVGQFTDFDVWAINLDGQIRIPLGFVEPYIRLGLGYAFLGAFQGTDMGGVTVNGWDAQAGFGIDLYPADFFSIGAGADFTILNLTRSESITAVDLMQDGAAVGLAAFVQAKAALHF